MRKDGYFLWYCRNGKERGIHIVSELLEDLNFKCDFKKMLSSNCGITIEEAVEEEEGRKAL